MGTKKASEAVGEAIARLIPIGLMFWAMTETHSAALKLCLSLWLLFVVTLWALVASGWDVAEYAKRRSRRHDTP